MKIFINPGHAPGGNPDPGVCGNGLTEAERVAVIGAIVAADLKRVGYDVQVLQHDDLATITNTSNNWGADLFVSIHCNGAAAPKANGTETWYFGGSDDGELLAECINSQLVNSIDLTDRGAKAAVPGRNGLYVLTNTDATAVLVETAFISNSSDAYNLHTIPDVFAHAIARGITDYVAEVV